MTCCMLPLCAALCSGVCGIVPPRARSSPLGCRGEQCVLQAARGHQAWVPHAQTLPAPASAARCHRTRPRGAHPASARGRPAEPLGSWPEPSAAPRPRMRACGRRYEDAKSFAKPTATESSKGQIGRLGDRKQSGLQILELTATSASLACNSYAPRLSSTVW